jgi:hypothetical protein
MPTTAPITVDLPATRRRIAGLSRYVEDHLLRQNTFICGSCSSCRRSREPGHVFRTGTMGHVGHQFDLRMGDKPLRVVVVGQEAKDSKVSLDARYEQVRNGSGAQRRYWAEPEHKSRNPHMRGTTSALRIIFGSGLHLHVHYAGAQPDPDHFCETCGGPSELISQTITPWDGNETMAREVSPWTPRCADPWCRSRRPRHRR